jgi:hypothetical protein
MEPEGILKAWTTKVLIKSARSKAMIIASAYSRRVDLRFGFIDCSVNGRLLLKILDKKQQGFKLKHAKKQEGLKQDNT